MKYIFVIKFYPKKSKLVYIYNIERDCIILDCFAQPCLCICEYATSMELAEIPGIFSDLIYCN